MDESDGGPSSPDLPDELVETVRHLDDHQLGELARYCDALLAGRSRSIGDLVRETEDPDRIVSVEEEAGYAAVVRLDSGEDPPNLYHVRREHHPDGSVDLHWTLIGSVVE